MVPAKFTASSAWRLLGLTWREAFPQRRITTRLFLSTNRNKKSVTLNLKTKPGRKILKNLVKVSDILIENWRPGSMDRLGIGYKDLEKLNPGLIYCSINGFGKDGPYSKRSAFDWIIQAIGGGMATTGDP